MVKTGCGCGDTDSEDGVDEITTPSSSSVSYGVSEPVIYTPTGCPKPQTICPASPEPTHSLPCGCGRTPCTDCKCQKSFPAVPNRTCSPTLMCKEDSEEIIVVNEYVASLTVSNSWVIPACGSTAVLTIKNLKKVALGSYLWQKEAGFFEIVAFDLEKEQVTVKNNCTVGNASPGDEVAPNLEFVVTSSPITPSGGGGDPANNPYLALDFTAPANGACTVITVTTTQGLQVNKNVQIGSGTYRVSSISSGTIMTICNDGLGAVPNTPVIARNTAGELQYPVVLIDANSCTNTPVTSAALLTCRNGVQQPLKGSVLGSIPVLTNVATNEVQFQSIAIPTRICTIIECCLTLVAGTANYNVNVADSSLLEIGDVMIIGSRTDRFTITGIISPTIIQGTISPTPSVTEAIPDGTSLCQIECCEDLQNQINVINNVSLSPCSIAQKYYQGSSNGLQETQSSNTTASDVLSSAVIQGTNADLDIVNGSTCRNIQVMVLVEYVYEGGLSTANARLDASYSREIGLYGTTVGTILSPPSAPSVAQVIDMYQQKISGEFTPGTIRDGTFTDRYMKVFIHNIGPQGYLKVRGTAWWSPVGASTTASLRGGLSALYTRITALKVTV